MSEEPSLQDWKDRMAAMVRYRMKAMGITAEDLAAESGLGLPFILRVLSAETYPSHKARTLMAKALGCSLEFVEPEKSP